MYIKIVPQNTNSSSGAWYLMESIYNVIVNGQNITSQSSSYINTALSFQTGSAPTSSMYTGYTGITISGMTYPSSSSSAYTSSTSNANRGRIAVDKKHYATGQATGFTASRVIDMIYGEMKYNNTSSTSYPAWDWGLRFNMRTQNNGGLNTPYNSFSHTWASETTTSTSTFTPTARIGADGLNDLHEIHIILNDTTFAVFARSPQGSSPTTMDSGMYVINDLEFSSSYDTYAYTGNTNLCPTQCIWAYTADTLQDVNNTVSPYNRFGVAGNYMDKDGTYRTHVNNDAAYQYHYGGRTTHDGDYAMIEPAARQGIQPLYGPNGEIIHQLIPVMYVGHQDPTDQQGDPRRGRFMNMYRTTDNFFQDGDVLIDGTTRYRVFRGHKTGRQDYASATDVACYAFPEDNVPYS